MQHEDDYPEFAGPVVQWPRYSATYRGEQFVIAPVPTDDGRWLLSVNEWSDTQHFYPTILSAIDAAMAIIKESVDQRDAAASKPADPNGGSEEADSAPDLSQA